MTTSPAPVSARTIRCPRCSAQPFFSCRGIKKGSTRIHFLKTPHPDRTTAAREAATKVGV